MPVSIGTNPISNRVQRVIGHSESALARSFERLSSGLRINGASDDAAGLAVADVLQAGARIFGRGVQNINDGISLLAVADGALTQLSDITSRILELTEQSANGSFSSAQRKALDSEGQTLAAEYLRIAQATKFNSLGLFDGTLQGLRLQGGVGVDGSIASTLGGALGTGTFGSEITNSVSTSSTLNVADINGDGVLDMLTGNGIQYGLGGGTFAAAVSFGSTLSTPTLVDVNGDGRLDVVGQAGSSTIGVVLNLGSGSFSAMTSFASPGTAGITQATAGDLNGDGFQDIVAVNGIGSISVFLGRGDGTFATGFSFSASTANSISLGDINGDGVLDLVTGNFVVSSVDFRLGLGNGQFGSSTSLAAGATTGNTALGDVNGDGLLDLVSSRSGGSTISVFLNNGSGGFGTRTDISGPAGSTRITLGDINGDGILDIIANGSTMVTKLGNGNGTFQSDVTYAVNSSSGASVLRDFNNDGVLDIATSNASVLLSNIRDGVGPLLPFSLRTAADALQALTPMRNQADLLAKQRGVIGAFQSRLSIAVNVFAAHKENYKTAESRIRDVEVAAEATESLRLQILTKAGAAILAQANQQPRIVLNLLR